MDNYKVTVSSDGTETWRLNGLVHRDDGPAVTNKYGKFWYQKGKLHREDGPSIIGPFGDTIYYRWGKLHREDGPSVENRLGGKEWHRDGQRHNEHGPAVIYSNGEKGFYLYGHINEMTEEEHTKIVDTYLRYELTIGGRTLTLSKNEMRELKGLIKLLDIEDEK